VQSASAIYDLAKDVDVIGIDEAQFFDEALPGIAEELADHGVRVIIAGLDIDYLGKPFGCMPALLAIAEYVTKVHAICMNCGDLAHYSHRIVEGSSRILLGEQDSYIPLCRTCYNNERKKSNG
jgi:thymidine kinase